MKALILAAGYGTRLYPLTLDTPKPLLKVGGRLIADHILDAVKEAGGADEVFVVTNQKFFKSFKAWVKSEKYGIPIRVVNDKTLTNETRLGAIGDIELVIKETELKDDLLIIAGDNLFDLDLKKFVNFAVSKSPASTVAVRVVNDPVKIKKYGVVSLDDNARVTGFEEKPAMPKSNLAAMCVYYFSKEKLHLVSQYMSGSSSKDAPGNYIRWLSMNDAVYGYKFEGEWFDIGDMDSYKSANQVYNERRKKC